MPIPLRSPIVSSRLNCSRVGGLLLILILPGCGGGGSTSQSLPPVPTPEIISVYLNPQTTQVLTGSSQSFTANVAGSGAYSSNVTWSVSGVVGGNSTLGTIANGQFTAPSAPPNPNNVTITATSVQDPTKSASATVTIVYPAVLTSITPVAANAGEVLTVNATLNVMDVHGSPMLVFPGINGTSVSSELLSDASGNLTAMAPFGATSGPVFVRLTPLTTPPSATFSSDSIPFTRLPNLRVHAAKKDLSSGETLQLDWRLLGASTPNVVTWTADSGTISSQGLFQSPLVSTESYSRITGCVQNTNSCNWVLLRILPFRITPAEPIVNVGGSVQVDALQGGSLLTSQWSVLAGGGSITSGGLFTAPTAAAQAGAVPISAAVGSSTQETSVAVSGGFPGLINRVYDYADFTTFTPKEATFVQTVAVNGNRAYAITTGNPYSGMKNSFEALDVYDISNPDQPMWIDAIESPTNPQVDYDSHLFVHGSLLFSIDTNFLVTYNLKTPLPTVTGITPIASGNWSYDNGVLYVVPSKVIFQTTQTLPLDVYDFTSGTLVYKHYELPQAPGGSQLGFPAGKGNIVYGVTGWNINNVMTYTIPAYDISQSPPVWLGSSSPTTSTENRLFVTGNTLVANSQVYDISNIIPVQVGSIPIPLTIAWAMQGNSLLVTGGESLTWGGASNYAALDLTTPANPVVTANVLDLMNWDIFNPFHATWAANGGFYTADGTGGIGVYNVTAAGGPAATMTQQFSQYTYDQVLQGQTLYQAAYGPPGGGELECIDVSSGTPTLVGKLFYANDSAFAVQVSGTTAFLGLADSLKVIDVSNPSAPAEIGSVTIPVNALAISGTTLFVGTGDGRLVVFDISTPPSPKQIGSVPMAISNTIHLSGSLLLAAAVQNGMLVFDVSQPNAPKQLSHFLPNPAASVWDVTPIGGSALMLAADSSGIVTVDISNPASPRQLSQQQLPFLNAFPAPSTAAGILTAFSLVNQNGLTYIGTPDGVMLAYDTRVANHPRLMTFNVLGHDDLDVVTAITPAANALFVAVQSMTIQTDNTVPQNSIELYYPPEALSYSIPITPGDRPTGPNRNLKPQLLPASVSATSTAMDRFGIAQPEVLGPRLRLKPGLGAFSRGKLHTSQP
jgi:hypothetical protein